MVVVSVWLAATLAMPYPLAFVPWMAAPLLVASLTFAVLGWVGVVPRASALQVATDSRLVRGSLTVLGLLGLRHAVGEVSWRRSLAVALIYSGVAIGLWPLVREAGLIIALLKTDGLDVPRYVSRLWLEATHSLAFWQRLWKWEAWSLARWWLLFSALTLAWVAATGVFSRSRAQAVPRLLAFAPWIVLLELAMLVGVWLQQSNVVPEPSTGFVVGIFNWGLWHWDAWLDRFWLVRTTVPWLVIGTLFFRQVLGWRWKWSAMATVLLLPVAIWLSIATSVAYSNGLPWPQGG